MHVYIKWRMLYFIIFYILFAYLNVFYFSYNWFIPFTGVNTGGVGSYIYDKEVNAEAQPWFSASPNHQHHSNHIHFQPDALSHISHIPPLSRMTCQPGSSCRKWYHILQPRPLPWSPPKDPSMSKTFWLWHDVQFTMWSCLTEPVIVLVIYINVCLYYLCIISISPKLKQSSSSKRGILDPQYCMYSRTYVPVHT